MRFFRHTLTQRLVAAGSDEVIGHCPLPSESKLNQVWCETHIVDTSGGLSLVNANVYGVDGRVMPDDDPGDATLLDLEWDLNVSKDQDVSAGAFSMDPGSSESAPMFEPGEPSMEALVGMGLIPLDQEFYKRRKMLSFASHPRGFEAGTPDRYTLTDAFKFHSRKTIPVEVMSNAVLVFSNPALDDVTTTAATTFSTEAKWMQAKYLEVVLEQAWMQLMGLTEAGAETPWEEAALLVEELLEPTVIEETAGSFVAASFNVFCSMTFDVTVPGRKEIKTISAA